MELLLTALLGVLFGIFTGLAPGIHVNLVCSFLLTAAVALPFSPLSLVVFIVALSITHTFLDIVPTVFLGAPDSATALGVLPAHRYLLKGQGMMAVKLSTFGALAGLSVGLISFPVFVVATSYFEKIPKVAIGAALLSIPVIMLLREKKRFGALLVVLLSSALGTISFRYTDPLFPLLSGLFGVSMLVYSLNEGVNIPQQLQRNDLALRKSDALRALFGGVLAGGLTAVLPGLGAAHAAVFGMLIAFGTGDHGFLILTGAIGTTNFFLSLAAYSAIEKARNGALIAATTLYPTFPVFPAIGAALLAGGIGCLLTLFVARKASVLLPKIPYSKLSIGVIFVITTLVVMLNGFVGLLILASATALGLLSATSKCARAHAMSCILVPVGLRFAGFPV